MKKNHTNPYQPLMEQIRHWSLQHGFQQVGITRVHLEQDQHHLQQWLSKQYHGNMHFMEKHGSIRSHPEQLVPGTLRILSFRMDYFPRAARPAKELLQNKDKAYISRYALGRDYHKKIRKALANIAQNIRNAINRQNHAFRVFTDSAPILERALARNAGLGWIGKNTCLIHPKAGSWFFLGEIFTDIPLPCDEPFSNNHCGTCSACIDICPTRAIVAPSQLDARRCISYLTIEYKGSIPLEFRKAIGNRIYGCDDCQLVCPWNRFSQYSRENDFNPRHNLDDAYLCELFLWTEQQFLQRLQGSPVRRIGYRYWLRNLAIALGNAKNRQAALQALHTKQRQTQNDELLQEHIQWAISNLEKQHSRMPGWIE